MNQMTLTKKSESEAAWYPTPIENIDDLLNKAINRGTGFVHVYALKRNIAYNLQYLEFLNQCLLDIKLSTVLTTQIYKNFILVGCSIMESLLAYLLIKSGNYKMNQWKLDYVMPGQEKNVEGKRIRIDCHIYKKLNAKKLEEMSFDAMIRKAESHKILGSDHKIYAKLQYLRKLRNKVHLHVIDEPTDTDWNAFQYRHLCAMAQVIHSVFTGPIFRPSKQEQSYFNYLVKHTEQKLDSPEKL